MIEKGLFCENKTAVVIAAKQPNGLLYGVSDFCNKVLANNRYTYKHIKYLKNPFDELPTLYKTETPAFDNRAIWTWGHVIYDYRSFIDNMVTLRLNMLVVWNDHLPYNIGDMIEYAHANNVKILLGFAWGWGEEDTDISAPDFCEKMATHVLKKYEDEYAPLQIDGLYFQSLTETSDDTRNGVVIAERISEMVNLTFERLHKKYPTLTVQFGLHATSVKEKLDYIRRINPKLYIVWEDCGAFPYKYMPHDVANLDETIAFTKTIATLRGKDDKFGVVFKGLTALDWDMFEHQKGKYIIGERTKRYITERTEQRNKLWKIVQAYWIQNADAFLQTVTAIRDEKGASGVIEGLLEDSMFEAHLYLPAIIYSETLWNPDRPANELIRECMLYPDAAFANEIF